MSEPKLGTGKRFDKLESKLEGEVRDPAAVAASIGRKKYGAKRMASMALHGKRRHMMAHALMHK